MESPIRGDGSSRYPELVQALLRQTEVCYTVVMATTAPHTQTHTQSNSNTHSQEQSHTRAWLPCPEATSLYTRGLTQSSSGSGEDLPMLGRMWSRLNRAFRKG